MSRAALIVLAFVLVLPAASAARVSLCDSQLLGGPCDVPTSPGEIVPDSLPEPRLPPVPGVPQVPSAPGVPQVPQLPPVPGVPNVPALPPLPPLEAPDLIEEVLNGLDGQAPCDRVPPVTLRPGRALLNPLDRDDTRAMHDALTQVLDQPIDARGVCASFFG